MGFFRFQTKLFLAISLVVAGALVAVHVVTQRKVREVYGRLFEERFTAQIDTYLQMQQARLEAAADWCAEAAESELVVKTLQGRPDNELMERLKKEIGSREFRPGGGDERSRRPGGGGILGGEGLRRPPRPGGGGGKASGEEGAPGGGGNPALARLRPTLVALVDGEGKLVPVLGSVARRGKEESRGRLKALDDALKGGKNPGRQEVGYMAVGEDNPEPREVVATPVVDPDSGDVLGALVVGLPSVGGSGRVLLKLGGDEDERIIGGKLLDGVLYMKAIPEEEREGLAEDIGGRIDGGAEEGTFEVTGGGKPYRVQFKALNPGSALPVAYNVSLFPLAGLKSELAAMRTKAILFGLAALAVAFLAAFLMARRISVPIHDLSGGTERVREGDYSARVPVRSKDELGGLAESFNEMAGGLAQREKFRNILGMVVDEEVARELVDGALELGGEEREASVLFCDIRGFTAITEGMAPQEVIGLVNEHMTAMTEVVHRYHGVVDKFVGDLIMAVFGVPKAYGRDAENAARCALEMVAKRELLNAAGGQRIEIGVGVATGEVVAGRMGSENRLEYTVLGERVNLASRLCGVAGAGEVVVDGATVGMAGDGFLAEEMAPVALKGFKGEVVAYRMGLGGLRLKD